MIFIKIRPLIPIIVVQDYKKLQEKENLDKKHRLMICLGIPCKVSNIKKDYDINIISPPILKPLI